MHWLGHVENWRFPRILENDRKSSLNIWGLHRSVIVDAGLQRCDTVSLCFGWCFKGLYFIHLPGFRVKAVHTSATSGNLTQDPLSPLIGPGSSNLHSCMWSNTTYIALLSRGSWLCNRQYLVSVDCYDIVTQWPSIELPWRLNSQMYRLKLSLQALRGSAESRTSLLWLYVSLLRASLLCPINMSITWSNLIMVVKYLMSVGKICE